MSFSSPSVCINDVKSRIPSETHTSSATSASTPSSSVWYGRAVNRAAEAADNVADAADNVADAAHSIFIRIIHVAQQTINILGSMVADTNMLAGIFRRLNGQVLAAVELLAKFPPGYYAQMKNITASAVGYIDTIQVATDVQYFASGNFKNDTPVGLGSRVFMAAANLGGALLWLEEMSFINLSKTAAVIGDIRVFSFVPAITSSIPWIRDLTSLQRVASSIGSIRVFSFLNMLSMNTIARRALTLMYVFLAVEAAQKVSVEINPEKKTKARLDLSYYLSELALDALITIGVTNVVGLGAAGALCIATALASFAYPRLK